MSARFESRWRPYPVYADSGVEWLGEIPNHWGLWKISHAFEYVGSGTTPTSGDTDYYKGDVPWVNTSELRDGYVLDTEKKVTQKALENFSTLRLYPSGTLLVAMYGATIGKVGILDISATTNQACCALVKPKHLDTRYTFYWLIAFRKQLISLGYGGGQPNISQSLIRSLRVSAGSLGEQRAIAAFLDRETAQIDALIAKMQRLIALLDERRAALISHAVTRGLDPSVPMRDSGIAWLGEIPAHWEVKRIRHLVNSIDQGVSPQAEATLADNDSWGVLKAGCVNGGVFNEKEHKKLPDDFVIDPNIIVKLGDLLVSRASGSPRFVGSTALVNSLNYQLILSDKTFRLNLQNPRLADFVAVAMNSSYFRAQIEQAISGAEGLANNLPLSKLKDFFLAIPPSDETIAITDQLYDDSLALNSLAEKTREAIQTLEEYRTALISAAVTGKIDVRGEV